MERELPQKCYLCNNLPGRPLYFGCDEDGFANEAYRCRDCEGVVCYTHVLISEGREYCKKCHREEQELLTISSQEEQEFLSRASDCMMHDMISCILRIFDWEFDLRDKPLPALRRIYFHLRDTMDDFIESKMFSRLFSYYPFECSRLRNRYREVLELFEIQADGKPLTEEIKRRYRRKNTMDEYRVKALDRLFKAAEHLYEAIEDM